MRQPVGKSCISINHHATDIDRQDQTPGIQPSSILNEKYQKQAPNCRGYENKGRILAYISQPGTGTVTGFSEKVLAEESPEWISSAGGKPASRIGCILDQMNELLAFLEKRTE